MSMPIRQPRGPSSNPSADSFNPSSGNNSPPSADQESHLRRSNTIGSTRHQPSASISASAAASGAFHGSKFRSDTRGGRFRSGSLSNGNNSGSVKVGASESGSTLSRKPSGRDVEVVHEDQEREGGAEGLNRQSSLPNRRGHRVAVSSYRPPMPESMGPPPRPPRRTSTAGQDSAPGHNVSHSMSSLASIPNPLLNTPAQPTSVSRTQSLRSQARHVASASEADIQHGLGRSSSLRQAGEHHRSLSAIASPPTPSSAFPPASSTAALPPFSLPTQQGADIKRHQSLGASHYGRGRGHLTLSPLDPRMYDPSEEAPPTSPIGRSVWAPNQPSVGDDGWSRSIQGVQEAFTAMNFRGGQDGPGSHLGGPLTYPHAQEEPSWVANLVGGRDNSPAPPLRAPSAPASPWQNDALRRAGGGQFGNQIWPDGQGYINLNYLQQQQQQQQHQQQMMAVYGGIQQGYKNGGMSPMPPNGFYNQPPPPPPAQDQEVIELARKKGLNPATFDCRPHNARFFVIKSYTEDDVQKSLKHEIWSSTVLGNKRLDTAFKENAGRGPVYLFFSVNSSRHFCGVAQMLTAVDETQSSTVWAQDKWKGIFKVKWIFVRDVPSVMLRHIRLINTTEQKPITNSRDTQEVHYDGGCEVLQIFLEHQNKSKTSLLQDFAYYENMSQNRPTGAPSPGPNGGQPGLMLPPPLPPMPMPMPPMPMHQHPQQPYMPGMNGVPPVPTIPSRYR
ncbi:YT521-B-like domain-containing protein [Dioszegia hungarica]|uniref:YT521-B-like domain-containing protein n=1 Tax=Dioszegia hungarica TaxID=4972 RepID=A0AA38HBW9_9TREE|nr:YT521-B-like domain-containing protein [Dioszegia hungarica]KAI9637385.1 YT521-B-like domain-containing protein [Dioszegia hungarica]